MLRVVGDIDLGTIPYFAQFMLKTADDHPGEHIALDLDEVGTLDDVGLGVILGVAGRVRALGGELIVIASGTPLQNRFAITGLDRAVKCIGSLHELE
ncbi:MAG: STAS domain-containing protein [Ilumatobacteraceae bacterium]